MAGRLYELLHPELPTVVRQVATRLQVFGHARGAGLCAHLSSQGANGGHAFVFFPCESTGPVARFVQGSDSVQRANGVSFRNRQVHQVLEDFDDPTFSVGTGNEVGLISDFPSFIRHLSIICSRRIGTRTIGVVFVGPMGSEFCRGFARREAFAYDLVTTSQTVYREAVFFPTVGMAKDNAFGIALCHVRHVIMRCIRCRPSAYLV